MAGCEPAAALRRGAAGSDEPSKRLMPFIGSSRGAGNVRRKGLRVREFIYEGYRKLNSKK